VRLSAVPGAVLVVYSRHGALPQQGSSLPAGEGRAVVKVMRVQCSHGLVDTGKQCVHVCECVGLALCSAFNAVLLVLVWQL
jgi:hypothetical protein